VLRTASGRLTASTQEKFMTISDPAQQTDISYETTSKPLKN
jgi:hypothetical protein